MYQVVKLLAQPFPLLMIVSGLAIVNLWRRRRESRPRLFAVTTAYLGLVLVCSPPVSQLGIRTLEGGFTYRLERPAEAEMIVVLAGGASYLDGSKSLAQLDPDSVHRCLHASELYHRSGPCSILVSGGRPANFHAPSVAPLMCDLLRRLGVRDDHLVAEERSRTTYESAVEVRKILARSGVKRVALVTEAFHMSRSLACYHTQGIEAFPAPCLFRTNVPRHFLLRLLPSPSAAADSSLVFNEWLGTAWYRLHGRL